MIGMRVGGDFTFPCPLEEGVRMDLFKDHLVVMIQVPRMDTADIDAFNNGVSAYSYLESDTKAPVAFWTFQFKEPLNHIECNFDARISHRESVRRFVNERLGQENGITFFLLQGKTIISMWRAKVCNEAWGSFYRTILAQLEADYTDREYSESLESMYRFTVQEVMNIGRKYSMK